jgi:hypothetical protein
MKDFFEKPPEHHFTVGDLVTCNCHGGVAIIVELYDEGEEIQMNMAKIWWIIPLYEIQERSWMHTISRLRLYGIIQKKDPMV